MKASCCKLTCHEKLAWSPQVLSFCHCQYVLWRSFGERNSFLDKNINTPSLKQEYQESVFHDLSLNSITIAYSTENDKLPVSDVTVLLDDKTNKVKRIFISTFYRRNDSTFREKYFWKAGKSFQINQSITTPANEIIEESTFIAWNDPDRKWQANSFNK